MVSIVHHCIRRHLLSCSPCFPLCLAADNDSKRLTDHSDADGCRPALNIDVMRVIAVCKTAAQLKKAVQKLGKTFKGCGRVKVRTAAALNCASISSSAFAHAGAPSAFPSLLFSLPRNAVCCCCCRRCCIQNNFKLADAAFMFHLRTFMCNFVFDFDVTFGKLKDRPGVMRKWTDHVERSDPAGGARRGVEQQRDGSRALPQIAGTGRRISGAAAAVEGFEGLDGAGGLGRELDPDGELVVAHGDLAVVVRRGVQVPRPPLAAQRDAVRQREQTLRRGRPRSVRLSLPAARPSACRRRPSRCSRRPRR